jgi:hypothetical protein
MRQRVREIERENKTRQKSVKRLNRRGKKKEIHRKGEEEK